MKRRAIGMITGAVLLLSMVASAMAEEAAPVADEITKSASASVSVMSRYVWRGLVLSDEAVVQPAIDFNYGGFNANLWANYDTDNDMEMHNETDLTLKYTYAIKDLSLSAGYIYYGVVGLNTEELFLAASYATLLAPTLTYYQDLREGEGGGFATLSIGHSQEVWNGISVGGGASVGYNFRNALMGLAEDGNKFSGLYNGEVSLFVNVPVTKAISVKPSIAFDFPLSDDAKYVMETTNEAYSGEDNSSILWGGVTVSAAF